MSWKRKERFSMLTCNGKDCQPTVPEGFSHLKIMRYLGSLTISVDEIDGDVIHHDCSTVKPARKGREMYCLGKVQLCEFAQYDDLLLFRFTVLASLKTDLSIQVSMFCFEKQRRYLCWKMQL